MYIYLQIYIYRERERQTDRQTDKQTDRERQGNKQRTAPISLKVSCRLCLGCRALQLQLAEGQLSSKGVGGGGGM